jgi:uncharacterized protein (TIGR02466 family)
MSVLDKSNIKIYHFGPMVKRYKLNNEFCKEMLNRGLSTKISHQEELAGIIEQKDQFGQYRYTEEDINYFSRNMTEILSDYRFSQNLIFEQEDNIQDIPQYKLNSLWINIMGPGDFNPPHIHSGDLSFVLYLKVPKELKEENERYVGRSEGPGNILLQFGENLTWAVSNKSVFPEENMMLVFSSSLRHSVYPYKSNVERISLSGNFEVINKKNGSYY